MSLSPEAALVNMSSTFWLSLSPYIKKATGEWHHFLFVSYAIGQWDGNVAMQGLQCWLVGPSFAPNFNQISQQLQDGLQ